jgi:hypothetical protein
MCPNHALVAFLCAHLRPPHGYNQATYGANAARDFDAATRLTMLATACGARHSGFQSILLLFVFLTVATLNPFLGGTHF